MVNFLEMSRVERIHLDCMYYRRDLTMLACKIYQDRKGRGSREEIFFFSRKRVNYTHDVKENYRRTEWG